MRTNSIVKILDGAECRMIEGNRCFVVSLDQFADICEQLDGRIIPNDLILRKYGLENLELRLSSLEQHRYYVCAETQPILDSLWNRKHKEAQ